MSVLKTVEKALDIIAAIDREKRLLGSAELAELIGTNKTTVYKIATVLCRYGYLQKDALSAKYFLGNKFLEIGSAMAAKTDIRTLALPIMRRLAIESGETVNLMVLSGTKGLYIEVLESEKSAKLASTVGSVDYLHVSGVGKVLLAYMPKSQRDYILQAEKLVKTGKNTITDPLKLEEELETVRKNGYAIDDEESVVGARCVAAPVFNQYEEVVASVSISALTITASLSQLETYSKIITQAALEISQGYRKFFEPPQSDN